MRVRGLTVVALTLLGLGATVVSADTYAPRQYYGHWQKHAKHNYHYRPYYYKPSPTYKGYKHHYVMYHPQKPKHYYFYNPYKKQYWGRCPTDYAGQDVYSKLADKDCRENIDEIPEEAFPAPTKTPALPESTDGATLELPPDDLPAGILAPK